jgi:predicted AAA+ superfamily ATPase
MYRHIYDDLVRWKNSEFRMPLILEGVRQCGKTYILKEFGERNYEHTAYFNFEDNVNLSKLFDDDLDPRRIIEQLGFVARRKIEPGRTLMIFDEIQFCNRALTALKYFCENAPEYHIVCAGSLLGIMLSKPYSFPVGKVDRLRMGPMSFREFLYATGETEITDYVNRLSAGEKVPEPLASRLEDHLRTYYVVGGMPGVVSVWIKTKDISAVEATLDSIMKGYMNDFAKHAPHELSKLTLVWASIPAQLARDNRKFIFGHVKTGARSKDLEDALEWLIDAGLVHKVKKIERPDIPLSINADNTSFKLYMADIGILRRMSKMPPEFAFTEGQEHAEYRGAMTENYVLCELVDLLGDVPYYWKSGGTAEVDFVVQIGMHAVPIEVKAGRDAQSKSLKEYTNRYSPKTAITTTMGNAGGTSSILLPLYLLWTLKKYCGMYKGTGASLKNEGS